MTDFAQLGIQFIPQGAEEANRALDEYAAKAQRAETVGEEVSQTNRSLSSTFGQVGSAAQSAGGLMDEFAADVRRTGAAQAQAAQATRDYAAASEVSAKAVRDAAAANSVAQRSMLNLAHAHNDNAQSAFNSRMQMMELTHVIRAVIDGMAAGISPMRLFMMEGARVAQVMSMGGGLGAAVSAMVGMLKPLLPLLATIGVAFGAAFGAGALAARELNKEHKDLLDGLGLDDKQLEHLKDKHVATTITIGDAWKGLWTYLKTIVDEHTQHVQNQVSGMLDKLTKWAYTAAINTGAAFIALVNVTKATWAQLPLAIGDVLVGTANATLRIITQMINNVIDKINAVTGQAKGMLGNAPKGSVLAGIGDSLRPIGHVEATQLPNQFKGDADRIYADTDKLFKAGQEEMVRQMKRLGDFTVKAAQDRIRDEAGKAAKERQHREKQPPRDTTDERMAQVAQALAQAQADQLQAQLSLTREAKERAKIQVQILQAEQHAKDAAINKTLADIADDKGLSTATKVLLATKWEQVRDEQHTATLTKELVAITEAHRQAAKEELDLDQARRQANIDLLKAQQDNTKSGLARYKFEEQILADTQAQERARLEAITKANGYTQNEVDIAHARLAVLGQIQALEREHLRQERKLTDNFNEANDAFKSVGDAFRQHDWANGAQKLIDAIQQAVESLKSATTFGEKLSSITGIISGIGSMIGGKAGGFISGAASGVMGGFNIGSTLGPMLGLAGLGPIGAVAGGLFGGLMSLFGGGDRAKKDQERRDAQNQAAAEANQRAQEIANQRRDLENRLIEASGDRLAKLTATRAQELSTLDQSNQDLAKQVYDAEDRAARKSQVEAAELQYLQLSGDQIGYLNRQRRDELDAIDATIQPLQQLVYAAQDASDKLATARDNLQKAYDAEMTRLSTALAQAHDDLSNAYDRESSALQGTIDTFQGFAKNLADFQRSLNTNGLSGLSPENAYRQAQSQFTNVQARMAAGDQTAFQDFQSIAQNFLNASQAYNGTSSAYARDLNAVKTATARGVALAQKEADVANLQLDQLKQLVAGYLALNDNTMSVQQAIQRLVTAQQAYDNTNAIVSPLLGLNQGVLSLSDAIYQYQAAQVAQAQAIQNLGSAVVAAINNPANQNIPTPDMTSITNPGYRSTNGDYAAYVEGNPDLLALYNQHTGMARGRSESEFGQYHWANYGSKENRPVRPYATGGSFMVGGVGGTDSQRVEFAASPDENVTIRTPEQMAAEVRANESLARAVNGINSRLDQLLMEAKADKTQRGAGFRAVVEKLGDVQDDLNTARRRAG